VTGLADALSAIEGVDGWLTRDQARRLYVAASSLRAPAQIVEIGSFRGRSTVVLALASEPGVDVVGIDPHAGSDRGPQEIAGFEAAAASDRAAFEANLASAGVTDRVRHVPKFSAHALADVDGAIDVLYVDGAHRYRPALDDIVRWGARVQPDGGVLLIHDAFSAIGVTAALLRAAVFGRRWRYAGRSGSLVEYHAQAAPMHGHDRAVNTVRQLAQLPWFIRNVAVKVALSLRLRRVARALGSEEWPY
jgi:predicted O-methyltransferase YrrM